MTRRQQIHLLAYISVLTAGTTIEAVRDQYPQRDSWGSPNSTHGTSAWFRKLLLPSASYLGAGTSAGEGEESSELRFELLLLDCRLLEVAAPWVVRVSRWGWSW